jgi:hypothetical protein
MSWDTKPYNEKKPFGKDASVVAGDNISKSKERYQAMRAYKEGRATAEQVVLLHECDRLIVQVIEESEGDS